MNAVFWREEFEERLARAWPLFVNCDKRMVAEGPFLTEILSRIERPRVLDAATGIGCEATWLIQRGFDVTANEYCPVMRRMATEHAAECGVTLQPSGHDWREFDSRFDAGFFNLILLLGNSFCLLHKKIDRVKSVANLFQISAPGGLVIVDERNFRYILRERSEILRGNFRFSGKVMYCGDVVQGIPTAIGARNVTFSYYRAGESRPIGCLDMYPFRHGEVRRLFEGAGFRLVRRYSDLKPRAIAFPDFFTYVFIKPISGRSAKSRIHR